MSKIIAFDMDGTVYDLYGVDNWLEKLRNSDVSPYTDGKPLVNLNELKTVCEALINKGYDIEVITWLSKGADDRYNRNVTYTKKLWVENNMPYVSKFTAQEYGTPKQKALTRKVKKAILVDDNAEVRKMWDTPVQRKSIDAKKDIIAALWELVNVA